ncbi:hypothetical protein C0584_02195 [Candidatus Parcubacteria bacterium]|nr:MAG: hypothetical protein C0584_02195 [Candidatus Parcubacteria bacterium]
MTAMVIISWGALILVIYSVNPESTNWIGISLFYGSLFLAILGSSSLLGFIIRFIALKQRLVFRLVGDAFRQSFFFSFFIVAILFFLSKDLFTWLNLAFLISALSILEFFLISVRK